jgi:hypothetical protein
MSANQTKIKVLAGVLRLESFTVGELCLQTGLSSSMVYRELSDLQKRSILSSSSALEPEQVRPRHRPPSRYSLSEDPAKRLELMEEVKSFLPSGFEEQEANAHYLKVMELLTELSTQLLTTDLDGLTGTAFEKWANEIRRKFEETRKELDRATWESEIDFSEGQHKDHPLAIAQRRYDELQMRFSKREQTKRARDSTKVAQWMWGDVLADVAGIVFPLISCVAASALTVEVYEVVHRLVKERIAARPSSEKMAPEVMMGLVASLGMNLHGAKSSSEVLAALAKQSIIYGTRIEETLSYVRQLAAAKEDYRFDFNEANMAMLSKDPSEAYESWRKYLDHRGPEEHFQKPLLARVAATDWSTKGYEEAVRKIARNCEATVAAFSQIPFESEESYSIEPSLYNPLHAKSGRETEFVPISGPLAHDQRLHVATVEAEQMLLPGLPTIACANLLEMGMEKEQAWGVAATLKPDERIVRIAFGGSEEASVRSAACEILESTLHADIFG